MEILPFNAELTVYLPAIDAEHLQIHSTVEELHAAIAAQSGPRRMEGLLRRLAQEVADHFAHEERLMRVSHYSEYGWHKRQHATARRGVDELVSQFRPADRASLSLALESLAGWLSYHISVADNMVSAHIRNYEREYGIRQKTGAPRRVKRPQGHTA